MKTTIVIPARYGSSRFPGKPLYPILGVSVLERVWRIACDIVSSSSVIIATEDQRVFQFAKNFGANVVITSEKCENGTVRTAEAIKVSGIKTDVIINLQGDAILTPPWILKALIREMQEDPTAEIITPAIMLSGLALEEFFKLKKLSPSSGTSVVFDDNNLALYFSKNIIPFSRESHNQIVHRHIGIYAYRLSSLNRYISLPKSNLENIEGLEQLRALEHGMKIKVAIVDYKGRSHGSVDTPQDVSFIEKVIAREGELVKEIHK